MPRRMPVCLDNLRSGTAGLGATTRTLPWAGRMAEARAADWLNLRRTNCVVKRTEVIDASEID